RRQQCSGGRLIELYPGFLKFLHFWFRSLRDECDRHHQNDGLLSETLVLSAFYAFHLPRRSRADCSSQLRLYQLGIGDCDPNMFERAQGIGFSLVEEMDRGDIFSVQKVEAKAFV